MSEKYRNREQSNAKHDILRRYLSPFAHKVLHVWDSLDFIDGFSGPWQNRDLEKLSDTSIGISLETLSGVAESRKHTPDDPKIRCIFNEQDKATFRRLENFVQRERKNFPLVKIETFNGSFEENAQKISSTANHAFQLLFVDPTGYTGFSPSSLKWFKGRSTEIIVNFMRSFIVRFVSGDHVDREARLIGLIGSNRAQRLLRTNFTVDDVQAEYLRMLKDDLGYLYSGYSPIHNPDRNEIHFNLIYCTNHPEGMETMRSAEYKALSTHDQNRFKKHREPLGDDLFSRVSLDLEIEGPYLRERRQHASRAADEIVAILLKQSVPLEFFKLAAQVQEVLFLKRTEIGDSLCSLAEQGRVEPTWRVDGHRKPKRGDKIKLC